MSSLFRFFHLTFIFLPCLAFSQMQDSTKKFHRRFSIGLTYSPDCCYRVLKTDGSSIANSIKNDRDLMEMMRFGFTAGIGFASNLGKKILAETGVEYSVKGEQTKKYNLSWATPDPSLPTKVSYRYSYRYISIPFRMSYFFARIQRIQLRFMTIFHRGVVACTDGRFFISGGLSANAALNQKTNAVLEYSDGHTESERSTYNELSRVNFIASGGIGFDLMITNHITCRIEPEYRRSVAPIRNSPVKEYIWSAGINTSFYF